VRSYKESRPLLGSTRSAVPGGFIACRINSVAAFLVRSSAVGHRWLYVFSVVVADE
jgi:hypothetical protein